MYYCLPNRAHLSLISLHACCLALFMLASWTQKRFHTSAMEITTCNSNTANPLYIRSRLNWVWNKNWIRNNSRNLCRDRRRDTALIPTPNFFFLLSIHVCCSHAALKIWPQTAKQQAEMSARKFQDVKKPSFFTLGHSRYSYSSTIWCRTQCKTSEADKSRRSRVYKTCMFKSFLEDRDVLVNHTTLKSK